ncbi:MAG: endonuclease III domain-containing protein [Deltaproteobacteria bacterium]|nr:endonuclease III domain-containing protein [Deltaproteobacteria bacterium]
MARGGKRTLAVRSECQSILQIYDLLHAHFGDLHWWPGDSPFEVIVGAILTQNTSWRNVERAIANLKRESLLDPKRLLQTDGEILSRLIRSSGYHALKTKRLKAFCRFLCEVYGGSLDRMFREDTGELRNRLLAVNGIGEETADSILLYAGNKPIFVVDAYTRRILQRLGLIASGVSYARIQDFFMTRLPPDASLYNQFHALFVNTGKTFCRTSPRCDGCPLNGLAITTTLQPFSLGRLP